jgi:hypothetical protein
MNPPLITTFVATNSGVVKPFNHALNFSLGHHLLCKWIVPAKAKLDKEVLRWGQCLLRIRHERLPMPIAIVLDWENAKQSFAYTKDLFN